MGYWNTRNSNQRIQFRMKYDVGRTQGFLRQCFVLQGHTHVPKGLTVLAPIHDKDQRLPDGNIIIGQGSRRFTSANVVFSEGATMFQWIFEHMTQELTAFGVFPHRKTFTVGAKRFQCADVMFHPQNRG